MKRKDEFVKKELAGQSIIVAVGEASKTFHGMIQLNSSGAFIWELLQNDLNESAVVDAMLEEYDVERELAEKDVRAFLNILLEAGAIE